MFMEVLIWLLRWLLVMHFTIVSQKLFFFAKVLCLKHFYLFVCEKEDK